MSEQIRSDTTEYRYLAIDLKSFYASVECTERGLDPLTTYLVVADAARTEKTICLAVSPALKRYGIPGRPRLFEVNQAVQRINLNRISKAPGKCFRDKTVQDPKLQADPSLALDFIAAPPRMALYMSYSTRIYEIYLKYVAPEDIHVYSCDEVFIDTAPYLHTYGMSAHQLALTMIREIYQKTNITATAGIGTNLYLAKVAMDIVAKHMPADENGVRIAALNEQSYRKQLWSHRPVTDFWRVGRGIAKRLAAQGLLTMGDVARASEENEDLLYQLFGVNAELLIDHAWGWEPVTISDIKQFQPETNSISSGQVLSRPYSYEETAIIIREMCDSLALNLVRKGLVTDQIVLTISYENFKTEEEQQNFHGEIHRDYYGRLAPKHSHGTANLDRPTSSTRQITDAVMDLYARITDAKLHSRRLNLTACHVVPENEADTRPHYEQMDLFTDYDALEKERAAKEAFLKKEKALQLASLQIKDKFGKNAILKGTDFLNGATARERNAQIGGHKA
ncbi:MAG: DNA methylase [Lachnospiraceae bacterium]|nr:DNA methylase [Lachnospiraceae bacterium]